MALPDGYYNIRFISDEQRFHDRRVNAEGTGKPLILGEPGTWPQLWDVRRQPDGEYTLRLLPVNSDGPEAGAPGFSWAGDAPTVEEPIILGELKQFLLGPTGSGPEGPDGGHYIIQIPIRGAGILPIVKCVGVSLKPTPKPELQIQEYMNDQKLPVWEFARGPLEK
ncbi:hypothetical protein BD779DRAFT_1806149 [Infundibulicybe gibba]|nr:hypothetical protein BD779DRAFT_1806149 [Infundibulicybe gibba]